MQITTNDPGLAALVLFMAFGTFIAASVVLSTIVLAAGHEWFNRWLDAKYPKED